MLLISVVVFVVVVIVVMMAVTRSTVSKYASLYVIRFFLSADCHNVTVHSGHKTKERIEEIIKSIT